MSSRWKLWGAGVAAAVALAGCGGGGSVQTVGGSGGGTGGSTGASSGSSTQSSSSGGSTSGGTPQRGGTLTMLGQSDIFNLDTVSAYYTVSTTISRLFTRQLFSYPAPTNSPAPPKVVPDIATTLPTTSNGGITDGGKTYTVHIKKGVDWNTKPARQVTAQDFVREFKMLCNPASPVGAPGYFTGTIVGMASYCDAFTKVKASVSAIDGYAAGHSLPGVVAKGPLTVVFHLTSPASDFLNIIAQSFASARPVEYNKYVPDSAQMRANTLSDGPYEITNYDAGRSFTLDRNPAWKASTDPIRKAYVDNIKITEGLNSTNVQQQLQAGTGDMEWDVQPPTQSLPALESSHDPGLVIGPPGNGYVDLGAYITLNQYAGPMKSKTVREAVALALNKNALVQLNGGTTIAQTTSQVVLPGNVGYVPGYNPFPQNTGGGNPAAAKKLLAQAGHPSGLAIKLLYSTTDPMPAEAQAMQASLDAGGFKVKLVPATQSDFYGKYLENPSTSKRDVWDIAPPGWVPDWFGNNGRSTIVPLLSQPGPGSNDFGGYTSPVVNKDIAQALKAPNLAAATKFWQAANKFAMKDVAIIPAFDLKWAVYHSHAVHGCAFYWNNLNCDPANVWLSK
jgi:ABC-type transport system substrate-binding protein